MPLGNHGQPELGGFISLLDRNAAILIDGPFPYAKHQNLPEDESIPMLRRYWGGRYGTPGTEVEVTHFRDGREVTSAWIEFDDPKGWGVRQERRIYFLKNRKEPPIRRPSRGSGVPEAQEVQGEDLGPV